jgi:hypothetical protein
VLSKRCIFAAQNAAKIVLLTKVLSLLAGSGRTYVFIHSAKVKINPSFAAP